MPERAPLAVPGDSIFVYDSSFEGFLCCVHESVYSREIPLDIVTVQNDPITLYTVTPVVTDVEKAGRVLASISEKISPAALLLIETVFLSCLQRKELLMLRFLLRGYREGGRIMNALGDPDVAPLLRAQKSLYGEAHLLTGFVRFTDYGGSLVSTITPKNFILPFIAEHFCARFSQERFVIYDKNHKAALIHQDRRREIISLDEMPFPEADETEERYRTLWKKFYHTIAIEARTNPRCRMTHMPKRYWENMTEML